MKFQINKSQLLYYFLYYATGNKMLTNKIQGNKYNPVERERGTLGGDLIWFGLVGVSYL